MKYHLKIMLFGNLTVALGSFNAWAGQTFNDKTWFVDFHYYEYKEPGVMTERSRLPSLTVGYQNLAALWGGFHPLQLGATAETSLGLTKYDGTGTTDNHYTKFLGEAYLSVDEHLYVGLGYRRLTDKMGGQTTSTGHLGYDRRSQYLYIPIGGTFASGGGRFKAQYNHFIRGQQVSYLSDTGLYKDLSNTQHSGNGLDLSYTPNSGKFQAYLRYWNIEKSEVVPLYFMNGNQYGIGWEPANTTFELGYRRSF